MFQLNNNTAASKPPSQESNTNSVAMELKGSAIDYETVAEYMKILRDSDIFPNTRVKHAKRTNDDFGTIEFEIESQLKANTSNMEINYVGMQKTQNL